MTGGVGSLVANARWEITRLRRSRRIWLFLIPVVAGPVGSAVSDLYLRVPSQATALILGIIITGGLGAMVALDLTALAVGEELARRAHLTFFPLPQDRRALLAGRLLVVLGGSLAVYGLGAVAVWFLGGALVTSQPGALPPLFAPLHLLLAMFALLLFLSGVTAAAAVITRTASEALVAGILAGVVVAGLALYFTFLHEMSALFPVVVAAAGLVGLGWALGQYPYLEA